MYCWEHILLICIPWRLSATFSLCLAFIVHIMLRQQNGDKKIRHKKGGIICRLLRYAVLSCKPDICDIESLIKTALFALLDDSLNGIELFVGSRFLPCRSTTPTRRSCLGCRFRSNRGWVYSCCPLRVCCVCLWLCRRIRFSWWRHSKPLWVRVSTGFESCRWFTTYIGSSVRHGKTSRLQLSFVLSWIEVCSSWQLLSCTYVLQDSYRCISNMQKDSLLVFVDTPWFHQ